MSIAPECAVVRVPRLDYWDKDGSCLGTRGRGSEKDDEIFIKWCIWREEHDLPQFPEIYLPSLRLLK